jgi:hypothetical protein
VHGRSGLAADIDAFEICGVGESGDDLAGSRPRPLDRAVVIGRRCLASGAAAGAGAGAGAGLPSPLAEPGACGSGSATVAGGGIGDAAADKGARCISRSACSEYGSLTALGDDL